LFVGAIIFLFYIFNLPFFIVSLVVFTFLLSFIILLIVPFWFPSVKLIIDEKKVDERTTIFSRMFELNKEGVKKDEFYKEYPELKLLDNNLRSLPGLLSPKSTFYNDFHFEKAEVCTCLSFSCNSR
jgi:hypothetical protein